MPAQKEEEENEEEAEKREVLKLTRGNFRSVSSLTIVLPHTHC